MQGAPVSSDSFLRGYDPHARSVRHEYEYCDVCVNRPDDNMLDCNFQVWQRLTSDLTPTPQQCDKEIDNSANRADQQSARHVRSWLQLCKMKSLP